MIDNLPLQLAAVFQSFAEQAERRLKDATLPPAMRMYFSGMAAQAALDAILVRELAKPTVKGEILDPQKMIHLYQSVIDVSTSIWGITQNGGGESEGILGEGASPQP